MTPSAHHLSPAWLAFKALRLLGDARVLPAATRRRLGRIGRLGYVPDDRRPRTFNEKLVWLLTHTDEPRRARLSDKLAAKAYVAEVAPWVRTAKVLQVAAPGERLDLADLPDVSVLKANNDSGRVRVLRQPVPEAEIADLAERWLQADPCERKYPWERHYGEIPPRVFVEEFLGDDPTRRIADYRISVFHGRVHSMTVQFGRRGPTGRPAYTFDRDWRVLPVGRPIPGGPARIADPAGAPPRPPDLDRLVRAAELLAGDLPYVRVDLYRERGEIWFGELTFSPKGGHVPLPYGFDLEMGEQLRLPRPVDRPTATARTG